MAIQAQDILLCLNMRQEHGVDGRAPLAHIAWSLQQARRRHWRVAHAYTHVSHSEPTPRGALRGLEPLTDESVFVLQGASPYSELRFADLARSARGSKVHLIGGVFSRAGLATALAARDLSLNLSIIEKACFAPRAEPVASEQVLAVLRASERKSQEKKFEGGNVICLEKWRT